MHHLTYVQAIFTGIVQGVTELFPISSLGHNVLLPALFGGSWAQNLNVSAAGSPYLAFVVGLHVATALAMIIYFRRDWARIVKAFVASIRNRRISTTDERLAWMIVLATIPVGIVGAALQKVFTHVFAKPTLTAFFLAVNGLILLYSERQRRVGAGAPGPVPAEAGGYSTGGYYYEGGPSGGGPQGGGPQAGYGPSGGYGPQGGYGPSGGHGPEGGYGPQGGGGYGPGAGDGGPGRGGGRSGRDGGGSGSGGGGYSQQPQQQQWQGPYEGQEPPRPSFTPHSQPPAGGGDPGAPGRSGGGAAGGSGREPRGGREAGEGDWTEWFSQEEARRGRPDPGYGGRGSDPDYQRGGGYERGGYEPAGAQDATAAYGRAPGYERPGAYERSGGSDRSAGYGRSAGYDPRYGGNPARSAGYDEREPAASDESGEAADERLSRMSWGQAISVGAWQILALLPGISRDGIVTVAGMGKGLKREDAVRFSFLLSAPVILAAGVLKAPDLFGPEGKGIHGPVLIGSIFAGVGAYFSVRFLTKYFSESRSLRPFGLYCLIFGVLSMAYLMVK